MKFKQIPWAKAQKISPLSDEIKRFFLMSHPFKFLVGIAYMPEGQKIHV